MPKLCYNGPEEGSVITIIAEAGVNHNGDLNTALKMVDAAVGAGADIVKFQTYLPDRILQPDDQSYTLLSKLALSKQDFIKIAKHCQEVEIEFLSTPGDLDSLRFLVDELGVQRIKIGSDDLTYEPLVNAAFDTGLPVILSTGMATMAEIEHAVRSARLSQLTLLHCVSLYPCPEKHVNLTAIDTLKKKFGNRVGYSDHTGGYLACLAAAARGVTVIEKHFMLSSATNCVDFPVSIDDKDLNTMVFEIRLIEEMLGTGVKAPSKEEAENIPLLRKGPDGRRRAA